MTEAHHIAFNDIVTSLEKHQDRTALIDKNGKSYSYKDFKRHITGARAELVHRGIKKGDRILVFVPMSLELYSILEAIFSLGATAIFLDPWMKGKKMGSVIKQVKPDLFVVTKRIAKISWILPATWKLKKWKLETIEPNDDEWNIVHVEDDDNALITFTSGTSGNPKGANRTFSFLDAQAQTLKHHLEGDKNIALIDYTNFPIVGLADFAMGNTVIIPRINLMKIQKSDPYELIEHLHQVGAMRLIVSPSLLTKIVEGIKLKNSGAITHAVTGGAPISNNLITDCLENHSDIYFEAIYGSTEAEPICITDFKNVTERLDQPLKGVFVGKAIKDINIKIMEFKDGPVDSEYFENNQLSGTDIGEVLVTGNHVNKNYYNNPDAFKKAKIVDQEGTVWHRTGDIGYFENELLYLVGRDHRIMEKNGRKYYPYPLEQFVEQKFGLTDVGYVKTTNGEFVFHIGSSAELNSEEIRFKIIEADYPCDKVIVSKKNLPRDARHKSKLQIENLT
jgi:long-subunit acyl-CoA synthetase (AMP-forming)